MRQLKVEDAIGVSVVHWLIADQGWEFREGRGATGDRVYGLEYLHQLYTCPAGLHRARIGAGAVGPGAADHRQQ